MNLEYERRMTEMEQRSKSNTRRIDKLEEITTEIHSMSNSMSILCEQMKTTSDNISRLTEKVDILEQEPAKRWKDSWKALFNAFLGAIGTAVAGGILYLISQG